MKNKEKVVVTYNELSHKWNHFEVAFLSFQEALGIIRNATYIAGCSNNDQQAPAIAVLALDKICENPDRCDVLKEEYLNSTFGLDNEEEKFDDYNVDSGHLGIK